MCQQKSARSTGFKQSGQPHRTITTNRFRHDGNGIYYKDGKRKAPQWMELRGLGLQGGLACASFIMDEASHRKKIAQRAERVKSVWDPQMGPEGFGMGGCPDGVGVLRILRMRDGFRGWGRGRGDAVGGNSKIQHVLRGLNFRINLCARIYFTKGFFHGPPAPRPKPASPVRPSPASQVVQPILTYWNHWTFYFYLPFSRIFLPICSLPV